MKKIANILISVFIFSLLFSAQAIAKDWNHLLVQKVFANDEKLILLSCYYFIDSREENESTKKYCDSHAKLITSLKRGFEEIEEPTVDVFFANKNPSGMREIYQVEVGGYLESLSNTIKRPNYTTVTTVETGEVNYFSSDKDVKLIILLIQEREGK